MPEISIPIGFTCVVALLILHATYARGKCLKPKSPLMRAEFVIFAHVAKLSFKQIAANSGSEPKVHNFCVAPQICLSFRFILFENVLPKLSNPPNSYKIQSR